MIDKLKKLHRKVQYFILFLIIWILLLLAISVLSIVKLIPVGIISSHYKETNCIIQGNDYTLIFTPSNCNKLNDNIYWYKVWGDAPFINHFYSVKPPSNDDDNNNDNDDDGYGGDDEGGGEGGEHVVSIEALKINEFKMKQSEQTSGGSFVNSDSPSMLLSSRTIKSIQQTPVNNLCFQGYMNVTYTHSSNDIISAGIHSASFLGLWNENLTWVQSYLQIDKYPVLSNHTCHYNTHDPTEIILFKPPKFNGIPFTITLILIGFWLIITVPLIKLFIYIRHHKLHHHHQQPINNTRSRKTNEKTPILKV